MTSKNPEDENRIIPPSESESHIDRKSTADKLGSHAVNAVAKDQLRTSGDYRGQINEILSAPLTPETFDGYAENALNEVIAVADEMIVQYLHRKGLSGMPVNGLVEDSIAGHYGVSIDEILDDLTKKQDQLSNIQQTVEQANKDKTVYIPPDESKVKITDGLVEFDPAEKSPKVETILFMLQQQYELDPNDVKDIKLISGTVAPEMMRTEPYILIDIPSLNRIILACNERRNITYVFDQEKIKEADISLDKLVEYTKKQLDALIKDFESIGIRITHTSKYLPKIEEALSSIKHFTKTGEKAIDDNPEIQNPSMLKKVGKAPEGVKSMTGVAKELGVSLITIKQIVEDIGDELGELQKYKFGRAHSIGYTADQIEKINAHIPEIAPKGVMSLHGIAIDAGVKDRVVQRIIKVLGDELGQQKYYRFGPRRAKGFSVEDVAKIKDAIAQIEKVEDAPKGVLNASGIAKELGVSVTTVLKSIKGLGDTLNEPRLYRFGTAIARGYVTEDIEKIIVATPNAERNPDDVKNVSGIAEELGVAHNTVLNAIESLGDELGEPKEYKFGPNITKGYKPEDVKKIIEAIPRAAKAPDGTMTLSGIEKLLGLKAEGIMQIIEELGTGLGEPKDYMFGTRIYKGYSPEQIEIIKREIEKRKSKK